MLRHVVRRWSTKTHTFICSWGEFTPTLEDVATIFHLPLCGSQDPFHIVLMTEDKLKFEALRKGAPTSPSTSLRFSNWIQFFWDGNRDEPCRLAAFVSLWLGRFLFCDFSQDCLQERIFPLALAIAQGSMIPVAPMFLGHLYRLLDQIQFLEKGTAGTMAVETFVNSSFLQIFLWERFEGVEVSPLPYPKARSLVDSDAGSYVPGTSQSKGKGKEFPMIPKRRSMRILETQFANTRKNKGEDSGPKVVVTVDDNSDDGSDDSGAAGTEINIHEQESTHDASGMDEDLDEDQYYSHDEDTYSDFGTNLEELDALDTPPVLASDHGQRVDIELVVPTIEDTIGASSEAGFAFPTTVVDAVLSLPAVQPPSSPNLCTPDMAADASPPLLAVPPPISPIPSAPDIAASTSPALPGVLPPTSPIPSTPDITAGTAPLLPVVLPPTSPIPSTPDIASGTAPLLPAVHPFAEIIDNSHKNDDAFIAGSSKGHSFEKGMSWQDWENSYTAFKAFFDGGVTILRSIDELLPLCHRFDGYVTFQGALVYPETVEALKRFMDKYGSLMEATDVTSSFSRCTALRALGLVLHGMDTMQLLDITDHKLLCWRDAICEAMILGFRVEFLLKLVKNLARAIFGARAIRSMQLLRDSDEVKAAADALNIKQQELENQCREMHALLLAKGISVDSAECVMEAAARLSPGASFVLFGHSP
ncbi:unnamed protein product [Prunus armeniaca]